MDGREIVHGFMDGSKLIIMAKTIDIVVIKPKGPFRFGDQRVAHKGIVRVGEG